MPEADVGRSASRTDPSYNRAVDLDLVFLGTAGSMPTAQRAPSALLLRRGADKLLIDCGEGTQRQMLRSTVGLIDLPEIFLTHYHADHYLGLPGMLKTFALRGRELPMTIYGPPGLSDLFAALRRIFGKLTYPYELVTVRPGDVLARGEYRLEAFATNHGLAAVGWTLIEEPRPGRFDADAAEALAIPIGPERGALQRGEAVTLPDGRVITPDLLVGAPRPGRKIVLTGDTAPSPEIAEVARGADVLVHEATFADEERERARETMHSTATDAAEIAREAEVGLLALTHVSNRYFGPEIAREAREIFPETVVPRDFDAVEVPFPERGSPRLIKGAVAGRRVESGAPEPVTTVEETA
jgi:ribonuclease Z